MGVWQCSGQGPGRYDQADTAGASTWGTGIGGLDPRILACRWSCRGLSCPGGVRGWCSGRIPLSHRREITTAEIHTTRHQVWLAPALRQWKNALVAYSLGLSPRNLAMNSNHVEKPMAARMSPPIMPAFEMNVAKRLGM